MKRFISIVFIFLCVAAEVAGDNAFLDGEESTRFEERACKIELEETLIPFFRDRNLVRREPTSRPLVTKNYVCVTRIAKIESIAVKKQYQLHFHTQQNIPVYLVKRVFLI